MQINDHLGNIKEEYLYLLEFELNPCNLAKFSGIKYVLMQGSNTRARTFAKKLAHKFLDISPNYFEPQSLTVTSRFSIYRIGNMLSVSHGMGNTSILSLLNELTKILHYAGSTQVEYIRIGTSGGIGVTPGSVIITDTAYTPMLNDYYEFPSLDKIVTVPTQFDKNLIKRIYDSQPRGLDFTINIANSIAADDFYLGQARFDGALNPKRDLAYRNQYFEKIRAQGIRNFEMESTSMAAFCNSTQIPATMIAVTLVNRMDGDQISSTPEMLAEFSDRSQLVAINYLLTCDGIN